MKGYGRMLIRNRRWLGLTIFAMVNLACWIGGAVIIGLAVGDRVDLGVERLMRQGQATAEAAWRQASQRLARPTPAADIQAPTAPAQEEGMASSSPTATPAWPLPSTSGSTSQPGLGSDSGGTPAATSALPVQNPTPQPEATLVSTPLLLADPQISSLSKLDAEMSRSAPDRAVQIRYQEDTLNREIATLWVNNPQLPYRDVLVDLQRDRVVVTGRATVLGFGVKAEVTGNVVAQDCVPQLEVESLSVAGIMTPRFVKDQVLDLILEAMTWYPEDYPLCLQQIVLEDTRATVYGYRR